MKDQFEEIKKQIALIQNKLNYLSYLIEQVSSDSQNELSSTTSLEDIAGVTVYSKCPEGKCQYPQPWFGTLPPACSVCGRLADTLTGIF